MKRFFSRFIFILITLSGLMLFMQTPSVNACSPATPAPDAPTPIPYTFGDHARSVDYVMIGTVIGGTSNSYGYLIDAEVQVDYYLKGEGSEIVIIDDFGWLNNCDRVSIISAGQEYIFFAVRNDVTGHFQLQRYLGRAGVDNREEETIISEIFTETNQSLEPSSMPLNQQIQQAVSDNTNTSLIVSVAIPVFILAGLILMIFRMRGSRRKSKAKRA